MINELKQYPKTWGEFVGWMACEHSLLYSKQYDSFVKGSSGTFVSNRELESYLLEWLDSQGVFVITKIAALDVWFYKLESKDFICLGDVYHSSRTLATEAGIIQAFKLLEKSAK